MTSKRARQSAELPRIRRARPDEASAISALAIRSKAHWDYTPEQLAVFRAELSLEPHVIGPEHAHVLEGEGSLLGFYTLAPYEPGAIELGHLFIDPGCLGRGYGRLLFQHACETARACGFERLVIQSDPNAAGFYEALGARLEGRTPSSIPGRTLPFFSLSLVEMSKRGPRRD